MDIKKHMEAVRDHSRQFSRYDYVYPVLSRRSRGLSLGVNLNPDKVCNFDCIYCEVDRRTPARIRIVDLERLREELISLIGRIRSGSLPGRFENIPLSGEEIRDIAFSGDGEPTTYAQFSQAVQVVAEVKCQERLAATKIVLITDASCLDKGDVRLGLKIMDAHQGEIWGKLDAGTESYYKLVNRSHVRFERILANLLETAQIRPIVIQTLLLKVHGEAMTEAELDAYCGRLSELIRQGAKIKEVHAYTIARPTPEAFAEKLSPEQLETMAAMIRQKTGLAVLAFE
jgi:wyosine [tRNA(Phe)-imidazoG37] synthetase (radical SAM superfamily)